MDRIYLLVFYGVSVVGLIYYCAKSRIFPVSYLILTTAVLTIFGGVVSVDRTEKWLRP